MYYYHFHQWLFFFYFYCIFGWCFESTFVSLKSKRPVNRGFMKGPWLPLYGSGAICVLFVTIPFQSNPLLVYLVGAVSATVLEYIVGVTMLALFKVRYWDYSYRKIQFQGQICLVSTIAWGFLSLLMVYVVHRPLADLLLKINNDVIMVITFVITILMVYDFANAFRNAMDLRAMIIQAEKLRAELAERMAIQKELLVASAEDKKNILESSILTKTNELQNTLNEYKYDMAEQAGAIEFAMERQIKELKDTRDALIIKMIKPAQHALLHNPGFKAPSIMKESKKLTSLIRKEYTEKKNTKK